MLVRAYGGELPSGELQRYLTQLGQSVARAAGREDLPWSFQAVASDEAASFALPGGHVLVTRGLLALLHDESQLAAVLAHEIAHVAAGHVDRQLGRALALADSRAALAAQQPGPASTAPAAPPSAATARTGRAPGVNAPAPTAPPPAVTAPAPTGPTPAGTAPASTGPAPALTAPAPPVPAPTAPSPPAASPPPAASVDDRLLAALGASGPDVRYALSFSPDQEQQADALAVSYLDAAGESTAGARTLVELLASLAARPGSSQGLRWLAIHPFPHVRLEAVNRLLGHHREAAQRDVRADAFRSAVAPALEAQASRPALIRPID